MSFLAPWFLLGTLLVAGPLLFHLVRRTPRGRRVFSSLMFLRASPPSMRRRSRLDERLLLVLRCAVVCLIALAFARPYLPVAAPDTAGKTGRDWAVLLDTSASMRRDGLWEEALARLGDALGRAGPGDRVAVFTFDDHVREVIGFTAGGVTRPTPDAVVAAIEAGPNPTWGGTDLGRALVSVADRLDAASDTSARSVSQAGLVLISDFQEGSRLGALDRYTWPRRVRLVLEQVGPGPDGNAGLVAAAGGEGEAYRVQVVHEGTGGDGTFAVRWRDRDGAPLPDEAVEIEVPAGESRVVSIPAPASPRPDMVLELEGDAHPFDNRLYLAPTARPEIVVRYLGEDAPDDPESPLYYLERALVGTSRRVVRLEAGRPGQPLFPPAAPLPHLVVGAARMGPEQVGEIRDYVHAGGTMVCVVSAKDRGSDLQALLGLEQIAVEEVAPSEDAMLGEIDFKHPLFARFADPRFNDFTAIRFRRLRRITGLPEDDPSVRVAARFDHGAPYLVDRGMGEGRILVLASGWHPRDSRLALSTKFVPLLAGMVEEAMAAGDGRSRYAVHDIIPIPEGTARVIRPDGRTIAVREDEAGFAETAEPGVYTFEGEGAPRRAAVNLQPAETRTRPLSVDELDQLGVALGIEAVAAPSDTLPMRSQAEASQHLWKWVLTCALGLVLVETHLAGRRAGASAGALVEEAAES